MRRTLDELEPDPADDVATKEQQYIRMNEALQNDLSNAFRQEVPCVNQNDGSTPPDRADSTMPLDAFDGVHLDKTGCGGSRPLTIWIAGTTCTDHSKRGKLAKKAGASMRPWHIWCGLVKHKKPLIVVQEITPSPDTRRMLHRELHDLYAIQGFADNPPSPISTQNVGARSCRM
eukprot:6129290-Pyramimonas_sp.AAC.2